MGKGKILITKPNVVAFFINTNKKNVKCWDIYHLQQPLGSDWHLFLNSADFWRWRKNAFCGDCDARWAWV